uniref:Uncharacterized protein n=1 Tax=Solanum demissum TaxID=50514 RepID=Q60D33_SOLDE|nr:hypothetical protein SDM1_55t00005 [Solanum demissum]
MDFQSRFSLQADSPALFLILFRFCRVNTIKYNQTESNSDVLPESVLIPMLCGAEYLLFAGIKPFLCREAVSNQNTQQALALPEKEVIQPHLPVRLPCYDFTPVTSPAFGIPLLAVKVTTSGMASSHSVTGGELQPAIRTEEGFLGVMIHEPYSAFYMAQVGEFVMEAVELMKLRETLSALISSSEHQVIRNILSMAR